MPEIWRKTEPKYSIIIWQSIEPIAELLTSARLNETDYSKYCSFLSDTRRREWVTVRTALNVLLENENGNIIYNANGRPELVGQKPISISHSGQYIAVMIAEQSRIGIDIEEIHPRIERLARKFVNDEENAFIGQDHRIEMIHVIWGAKEVLYKIHSRGSVDFKKDLLVSQFEFNETGNCHAFIKKNLLKKSSLYIT